MIERGAVSSAEHVAVQGEASWPLTWYLRRAGEVRFVMDDYWPRPSDEVVVMDPARAAELAALGREFRGRTFVLRSAWVPPTIDFGELLCLRRLANEPAAFGPKMRRRLDNSAAILKTLGEYLVFRKAYGYLPSTPGEPVFGDVLSSIWVRERVSPVPLLPPLPDLLPDMQAPP
jgi:hypothetical protein